MEVMSIEEWNTNNQPRSYKHKEFRVSYNCKKCGKEVQKRPSALKNKNLERLFCSLSCSTSYRNVNDGVPAQKEGWREHWVEVSKKNGTYPAGENNGRWVKDRSLREFVHKNSIKYTQRIEYAISFGYRSEEGKQKFAADHGYTIEQLKDHIEKQFKEGMSWRNYGEWEIDHIKPISKFLKEGITEYLIISALSNLQPLWRTENRMKNQF